MQEIPDALPIGTKVDEFRIDRVLGQDGYSFSYLAWDLYLEKPVVLREYCPHGIASRVGSVDIAPCDDENRELYVWGLERFLQNVRASAQFDHPSLLTVRRLMQMNGTGYVVTEYVEGELLSSLLGRGEKISVGHAKIIFEQLLSALKQVHASGHVHMSVNARNIMIRQADGCPVLLEMGAAILFEPSGPLGHSCSLGSVYIPVEQYQEGTPDVGPWSDLYALGIVVYRCVSGLNESAVPSAVARASFQAKKQQERDIVAAREFIHGPRFGGFSEALDWCVQVYLEDRPGNADEVLKVLETGGVAIASEVLHEADSEVNSGYRKAGLMVVGLLVAAVVVVTVYGLPF